MLHQLYTFKNCEVFQISPPCNCSSSITSKKLSGTPGEAFNITYRVVAGKEVGNLPGLYKKYFICNQGSLCHSLYLNVPASWRALGFDASRRTHSFIPYELSSCFLKRFKRRSFVILRKQPEKEKKNG